jgi:hypothetical protein
VAVTRVPPEHVRKIMRSSRQNCRTPQQFIIAPKDKHALHDFFFFRVIIALAGCTVSRSASSVISFVFAALSELGELP